MPCQTGTTNCASGGTIGYSAGAGYDQATGLGSIDANNLALFWSTAASETISPVSLSFASQTLGIVSTGHTVTITNSGATSLSIASIAITGTNASDFTETQNCTSIIAPGGSCPVSVTFKPSAIGSRVASLVSTDNSIGSPHTVSLSGTGIPVSFSPVSLSFASEAVGTGAATPLVVNNVGPTSLTVTSITITGTNSSDFSQTNNCIGSIAPGASCTINVTFTPGATGSRGPAILTIFDNAGSQTTTLSGIGSAPLSFVPVTPCRIADTRNPTGPFGGPTPTGGATRSFTIPNSACGIPSTAAAYSLNATVVPQQALSYLTIWPTGGPQPIVSTLNSDGRIKANAAIVSAGAGEAISLYVTNTTDVILDVDGYFVSSTALAFYPTTPCRLVDTRSSPAALGGPTLTAGQTRSFPLLAGSCGVPATAQAYSLNFTAVPQGPLSYLTVWPTGQMQPIVSTLNALTGTTTANAAIVPAGTNGAINTFATNATDLIIDIDGYFAPGGSGGLSFYTLPPCRVLDTRLTGSGQPFSGLLDVNVTGSSCGVPSASNAYVVNATVVPQASLAWLATWPAGQAQPVASTLNSVDGSITSNMALVSATNGSISVFATNATQLILDISGYFAP